MCDKGCFSGAKVVCGKEMTAQEILKEILADKAYYGNDAIVATREQKIVTATNSTMIAPADFSKLGYILTGWNTRPDGKGTSYTDGQILNISSDLTLYAQWTLN